MKFYSANGFPRPRRLSDATRLFAYESLDHKYGLDTLKVLQISLDHIEGYAEMTPLDRHNIKIFEITS